MVDKRTLPRVWNRDRVHLLDTLAGTMPVADVAKYMDATIPSIQRAAGKHGISLSYHGKGSANRTVSDEVVKAIRYDLETTDYTQAKLASLYGVTEDYVWKLANTDTRTKPYRKKVAPKPETYKDALDSVFN